jgi:TonB family protein
MRYALALLVITASIATAQNPTPIPQSDVLRQVPPEYPLEARQKHETGSGLLVLHVDCQTGRVMSVTVGKSTGFKDLDDAGIRAFSQWRFKPGAVKDALIKIPIRFRMWKT